MHFYLVLIQFMDFIISTLFVSVGVAITIAVAIAITVAVAVVVIAPLVIGVERFR
ncbi:hypothetical protein H1R20_g2693, partial [Candolleomyces eurysporus]